MVPALAFACLASLAAHLQDPQPAAPAAGPALKLTAALDREKYEVGDEFQVEVRLENGSDKEIEVGELAYQEGSVTFTVGARWQGATAEKPYRLSIVRPDPQTSGRLLPARIMLGARKSLSFVRRFPTLAAGQFSLTAQYQNGTESISSPAAAFAVTESAKGSKLVALVETEKHGRFSIELSPQEAPRNVTNFIDLVRRGFYKDMKIHRIVRSNWIQTGCPYSLGIGGPGYTVEGETGQALEHVEGSVSMAGHEATGHHGSQFFICLTKLQSLNRKFTIIGQVQAGQMEAVKAIGNLNVDKTTEAPTVDVRIRSIVIDCQK